MAGAIGPDGIERSVQKEHRINEAFFQTFRGEAAKLSLDYLQSITLKMVNGPDATDSALRHREGMRDLMRIINKRIQLGEEQIRQTKKES